MEAGTRIGSYEIIAPIDAGGMGVVYRARHVDLGREVAIKVLLPNLMLSEQIRYRFKQEAYVQAKLIHPNIVQVSDSIHTEKHSAIVMEYVDGGSLANKLDEKPGAWSEADFRAVFGPILDGVAYAHGRGVVHRDIKPENVLLAKDGTPKVADFGIAKILAGDSHMTRTGAKLGTVPYMSPEQFEGDTDLGTEADVFALGILAWRMLTGGLPINGDNTKELLLFYTGMTPLASIGEEVPGLSPALVRLIDGCLAMKADQRPKDASVMQRLLATKEAPSAPTEKLEEVEEVVPEAVTDLEVSLTELGIETEFPTPDLEKEGRRFSVVKTQAIMLGLLALLTFGAFLFQVEREEPHERAEENELSEAVADDPTAEAIPIPISTEETLSAGGSHTCALRMDNTVECWGRNDKGRTDAPGGKFAAVSAGGSHSCALRTDNTITCWGKKDSDQRKAPGGKFVAVSAGWKHTCALRTDNTVECWGRNDEGRTDAPGGKFAAVSAGGSHSCALRTDNTITCWGSNDSDQRKAPGGKFVAVSAGWKHTCALRTDNTVECWGRNDEGRTDAPGGAFAAVSAGEKHTCALRTDNTIKCWGSNNSGKREAPEGKFVAISAGYNHTCALRTDNTIKCWGWDKYGQRSPPSGTFATKAEVLTGAGENEAAEVEAIAPPGPETLSAGHSHTCALRTDNTITCWGDNIDGEADTPTGTFAAVSAGYVHTCALRTDNTITCWGGYDEGKTNAPKGTFAAVSAGRKHTCALRTNGNVVCWGYKESYQRLAPTDDFTAISAGGWHACGLRTDNTIQCGGINNIGQTDAPKGLFAAVSAGGHHTCALRTDNTIACWGLNKYSQTDAPTGQFAAVSAGWKHTCALRTDNTIACWGLNKYSQTDAPEGTFVAVSAGGSHTCALRTDNTITCWGYNDSGKANAPSGLFQ